MNEVDAMLQENPAPATDDKEAFYIRIQNKVTGITKPFPVYATNTLGQILHGYGEDIGLKPQDKKYYFYNEQVTPKRSTSNQKTTIAEFAIGPDDTLGISDEGSVAGD